MNIKKLRSAAAACMLIFCSLLLTAGVSADSVEQTAIKKTSIPIKWETTQENVISYSVYKGEKASQMTKIADVPASETTYVVPAEQGTKCYIKVRCKYRGKSSTYTLEKTVGLIRDAKTVPSLVTNFKVKRWRRLIHKLTTGWDKVQSADGYQIVYRDPAGKKVKTSVVNENLSMTDTLANVNEDITYTARIRAFTRFGGKVYYGKWSGPSYLVPSPYLLSSKVADGKLKLTWKPVTGATSYEIYVSYVPGQDFVKVKKAGAAAQSISLDTFNGEAFDPARIYYVYIITRKKVDKTLYLSSSEYYWQVGTNKLYLF